MPQDSGGESMCGLGGSDRVASGQSGGEETGGERIAGARGVAHQLDRWYGHHADRPVGSDQHRWFRAVLHHGQLSAADRVAFAETEELVALTSTAARCGGIHMTHMRSEGAGLLEAVDETIDISRRSGAPTEIYHLKAGGREYWPKMDGALERIEAARKAGLRITTDMYAYPAGTTGLDAAIPRCASG